MILKLKLSYKDDKMAFSTVMKVSITKKFVYDDRQRISQISCVVLKEPLCETDI